VNEPIKELIFKLGSPRKQAVRERGIRERGRNMYKMHVYINPCMP
jgi:hypothetical protein